MTAEIQKPDNNLLFENRLGRGKAKENVIHTTQMARGFGNGGTRDLGTIIYPKDGSILKAY
jgi:hypothetical protein